MQQLERQVIDAERQAEKAFQQVEYNFSLNVFSASTIHIKIVWLVMERQSSACLYILSF